MNQARILPLLFSAVVALFLFIPHISFAGCGDENPGGVTNGGTEFYIVFMQNEKQEYDTDTLTNYQDIYLTSYGDSATVLLSFGDTPTLTDTIHLGKYDSYLYTISRRHRENHYIIENSDSICNTTIHVTSDAPISCYGMNHKIFTADGFLCLPINVARTGVTYMAMTFPNSFPNVDPRSSEICVVSFNDSNLITIIPSANTKGGHPANIPYTLTLNKGQCIQIQAEIRDSLKDDLTGTFVFADLPITLYCGHQRCEVPSQGFYKSRDHLIECIPPLSTWGKRFIVAGLKDLTGERTRDDVMRVLSGAGENHIVINDTLNIVLQSGEFIDLPISPNSLSTVIASDGTAVGLFASTTGVQDGLGDPFFAFVPPLDQTFYEYNCYISSDRSYNNNNYLSIVSEATGFGKITLDGPNGEHLVPSSSSFIPCAHTFGTLSYGVIWLGNLSPGTWRIRTPNIRERGMTVMAYGFGQLDSYGYTAGGLYVPQKGLAKSIDRLPMPSGTSPITPSYTIQNILGDPIYCDSIIYEYSSNPNMIQVSAIDLPATMGFGRLEPLQKKSVTFRPAIVIDTDIIGKATIYYHSGLWSNMDPLELPFHIYPARFASVSSEKHSLDVQIANPMHRTQNTSLTIVTDESSAITIDVFDALGRKMFRAFKGQVHSGSTSIKLPLNDLSDGLYLYELTTIATGAVVRGSFLVSP